ncbi:MAG TPA: hypothetical protein VNM37_22645 [Candidatus Dormibacteraeota bacterium]|nr:hypothetical protein [Candidatus Dormibacteraeota bacterium]
MMVPGSLQRAAAAHPAANSPAPTALGGLGLVLGAEPEPIGWPHFFYDFFYDLTLPNPWGIGSILWTPIEPCKAS